MTNLAIRYDGALPNSERYAWHVTTRAGPLARGASGNTLIYYFAAGVCGFQGDADVIGYDEINAKHPEWFLLDNAGKRIVFKDYGYMLALDPAAPGYAEAWAEAAIRACKQCGAGGVFMDNCNSRYDWNFAGALPKYSTQESYGQAMDRFVDVVATAFTAAGLRLIGNVSGEYDWTPGTRLSRWLAMMDGFSVEGSFYGDGFAKLLQSVLAWTGKDYIYWVRPGDGYQIASALLLNMTPGSGDLALTVPDLGLPSGKPVRISAGWKREFERGTAILNTSEKAALTAVTLPAHMGLVRW